LKKNCDICIAKIGEASEKVAFSGFNVLAKWQMEPDSGAVKEAASLAAGCRADISLV